MKTLYFTLTVVGGILLTVLVAERLCKGRSPGHTTRRHRRFREDALSPPTLLVLTPHVTSSATCALAVSRAKRLLSAAADLLHDPGTAVAYVTGAELQLTAAIAWRRHQILTGPPDRRAHHTADMDHLERRLAEITDMRSCLGERGERNVLRRAD